ncbi:hypothetical protein MYX07_06005 [Patescibacteria group bacterium AH-259-L07]|nr:hypothetical protein [Patescibacteria group bacterium AH-259-L07]
MRKSLKTFFRIVAENPIAVFAGSALGIFLGIVGKVGAGTFIVDHICLFIGGYFITYWLYRYVLRDKRNVRRTVGGLYLLIFGAILLNINPASFMGGYLGVIVLGGVITLLFYKYILSRLSLSFARRVPIFLFFVSVLALWAGGIPTYFELVESGSVYFGLVPQTFVGPVNGNDFMWNGFGVHLLMGRVVPEVLIPTHRYLAFTILAILSWIFCWVSLLWGCLFGNAVASLKNPKWYRLLFEHIRAIGIGLLLWVVMIGLSTILSGIYSLHVLHVIPPVI